MRDLSRGRHLLRLIPDGEKYVCQVRPIKSNRMAKNIKHNINCADLFPVPIVIDNFGESARELNRRLMRDIHIEMEENNSSASRSFVSAWQSAADLENKYDSFLELKQHIETSAATYLAQIKFTDVSSVKCAGLWANCISTNTGHSMYHIHGSGMVIATGVYYPVSLPASGQSTKENLDDFNPQLIFKETGVGGELVIYDPSYIVKRQVIKPPESRYYEALKVISPRESVLILFPQYLPHSVEPLLDSQSRRYSISFTIEKGT